MHSLFHVVGCFSNLHGMANNLSPLCQSVNSYFLTLISFSLFPQPMRPLKATATTSKPVLTMEQIETIFYKIQDIYEIHKEFYDALFPNIQQWDDKVTVGHLFQKLVSLSE